MQDDVQLAPSFRTQLDPFDGRARAFAQQRCSMRPSDGRFACRVGRFGTRAVRALTSDGAIAFSLRGSRFERRIMPFYREPQRTRP
jgi:hypothetical protein